MRRIPWSRSWAPHGGQSHERPHPHFGIRPLAAGLWLFQRQVPEAVRGPHGARDEAASVPPQSAVSLGGVSMTNGLLSTLNSASYSAASSHGCRYIHSKNRAAVSFSLALNSLSDRTMPELLAMRGRKHSSKPNNGLPFVAEHYKGIKVPESIDWRLYGTFVEIKTHVFLT